MNYYEELGIGPNATTGEIREAYKLVARLLHPDNHRDPRLKDLAECQMKRLGCVLSVLVDPSERARYDAGLAHGLRRARPVLVAPPSGTELLRTLAPHWFWVLLASMTIGMGVWYAWARGPDASPVSDAPRVTGAAPRPAGALSATVPTAPVAARREPSPLKIRRMEPANSTRARTTALPPRATVATEPQPAGNAPATPPMDAPAVTANQGPIALPAVRIAEPAAVARTQGEAPRGRAESRFAGEWLYAADAPADDRAGAYPAKYVEFRLRERDGVLAGDYRALHRVADRAISSEVAFRVRGQSPSGNTATLVWESSAGALGELELTLLPPNQLQVKWWTTRFGRRDALSSGMSVLKRLKTP